ncbi:MAG: excinuclease ABC subunit UvrA [Bacteroidia bacterium]
MTEVLPPTIRIVGARQHTLKNITVEIPRHQLTVICGWSGSGKTTLAFDTLYAEGFSAYVESLSTYVRQFLPRLPRPAVDRIEGLAPAIALQQNRFTSGFRSTVFSLSELYPYVRLLFARVSQLHSPLTGEPVERYTLNEVVEFLLQQPEGSCIWILKPPPRRSDSPHVIAETLAAEGYDRFYWNGQTYEWPDFPPISAEEEWFVVVDRVFVDPKEVELRARLMESLEEVWYAHDQQVWVGISGKGEFHFSGKVRTAEYSLREPVPELFNYLSAYGACPICQGRGVSLGLNPRAVLPNPRLSLKEGLVALWEAIPQLAPYKERFIAQAAHEIPPDLPYYRYTAAQRRLLWWGDPLRRLPGIAESYLHAQKQGVSRSLLYPFQGEGPCLACEGSRLHPDTRWFRLQGKSLADLFTMTIGELAAWLRHLELPEPKRTIAEPLLNELRHRTAILEEVGLGYLPLDRPGESLSGGESQRLQLAIVLGSQLTGAIYVLDEPTIGLHPRDTHRLLSSIQKLRSAPNTVVVVEHDELFIRAADHLIEMGPKAGAAGGEVIFAGSLSELLQRHTPTARYLRQPPPPLPKSTFTPKGFLTLKSACLHNLKNITVQFPAHCLTVVTGVSGSGKTTLVLHLLGHILSESVWNREGDQIEFRHPKQGYTFLELRAKPKFFEAVEILSPQSLTRNRRSIVATVSGAYEAIRQAFAQISPDEIPPSYFSFNVPGGRCETCQGEGVLIKSMQFLADIRLPCPSCNGQRFQPFILDVRLSGKNIAEVLDLTVEEAINFFAQASEIPPKMAEDIIESLKPLLTVGLGYLRLGQSTVELSGGEATRLKLLPYLHPKAAPTLFLIDEPTTGLHFDDVARLLQAFRRLVQQGHTLIVIEHNLDFIAQADWIIDLGSEGGEAGGEVLYQGPLKGILQHPHSYTAQALRQKFGCK